MNSSRLGPSIRLLLTAVGCPGAVTMIRALRHGAERDDVHLKIVGADCDPEAVGRWFVDEFEVIEPAAKLDAFQQSIIAASLRQSVGALLSQSSAEVLPLARIADALSDAGVAALAQRVQPAIWAEDKYKTYQVLNALGFPVENVPRYKIAYSTRELRAAAEALGYPERPVCFKPPITKGSRGFRVIDARAPRAHVLMNEKPTARYVTLDEMDAIFAHRAMPELLVMEYVRGPEVTADVLCDKGDMLLCEVKTNEAARWGVTVKGALVYRPDVVALVKKVLDAIPLSWCVNLQFIDCEETGVPKLIEINPRVSTFVHDWREGGVIIPWEAVKLAYGLTDAGAVRALQDKIAHGLRFERYMEMVTYDPVAEHVNACAMKGGNE